MVTPATSFCDADSVLGKLVGGEGCVSAKRNRTKNFFRTRALPGAMKLLPAYFLRTTCARNFEKDTSRFFFHLIASDNIAYYSAFLRVDMHLCAILPGTFACSLDSSPGPVADRFAIEIVE